MCNLRKLVLLAIGSISVNAFAEDWQPATLVHSEHIDISYTKCYYKGNYQNYSFSFVIKGSFCPNWVDYDPITGKYKE